MIIYAGITVLSLFMHLQYCLQVTWQMSTSDTQVNF